jgi:putative glycosyltransferase
MLDSRHGVSAQGMNMRLSIVSTLYYSAPFIDEFVKRCLVSAEKVTSDFEIVLIDDGSPDASLSLALVQAQNEPRIKVIELSRNFGHHAAILTGLAHASGELVFLVDSDLEEPPELLGSFLEAMKREDADVIFGVHDRSQGRLFHRWSGSLFWALFGMLSDVKPEANRCAISLMTRQYAHALSGLPERKVSLAGLFAWPGFKQIAVKIERNIRREKSTYTFAKRVSLFAKSIVDFSAAPLVAIFYLGMIIAGFAFATALYFLVLKIVEPDTIISGFTSIIVSIWLVGGIIIAVLGVVGIYVSRLYIEAKGRPRTIVRRIYTYPANDLLEESRSGVDERHIAVD